MAQTKLTSQLSEQIQHAEDSEMLDIIVELELPSASNDSSERLSRQEQIAALRENFVEQCAPVENAITEAGGEVTGRAWINQTLKARVPVKSIEQISAQKNIAHLDVPQPIEKD